MPSLLGLTAVPAKELPEGSVEGQMQAETRAGGGCPAGLVGRGPGKEAQAQQAFPGLPDCVSPQVSPVQTACSTENDFLGGHLAP